MDNIHCGGKNCDKKCTCRFHANLEPNKTYQFIDYSVEGFGKVSSDGRCEEEYSCGDYGNYRLYKPTEMTELDNNDKLFKVIYSIRDEHSCTRTYTMAIIGKDKDDIEKKAIAYISKIPCVQMTGQYFIDYITEVTDGILVMSYYM